MYKAGNKVRLLVDYNSRKAGEVFIVVHDLSIPFHPCEVSLDFVNRNIFIFALVDEKPKNFFSIKQGQIEAAARFIVANNKYMNHYSVDSISAKIKNYIKEMIDKINSGKESYYCATAGFVISIGLEDDNYYVVEVLVSPDVSIDEEFVNVEEII